MAKQRYHSFRFWIQWFIPMPWLILLSKRRHSPYSHIWYQDETYELVLKRRGCRSITSRKESQT